MKLTDMNQLLEWSVRQTGIVLYGAGMAGKMVLSYLKETGNGWKIKCFAETAPEKGKEIETIPVCRLNEIKIEEKEGDKSSILVTTTEKFHEEILAAVEDNYGDDASVAVISDSCIGQLRYMQNFKQSVVRQSLECQKQLHRDLTAFFDKILPLRQLTFSVNLCDHCNLNCAGCNNYAPLADEHFTDINQFERDIKRLSELSGGDAHRIQLTGGEPLLNPKAIEYAVIARSYFPNAWISFVSNGLLLTQQTEDFFDKCIKYEIKINLTPYPITIDYEAIGKFLDERGVKWSYQNGLATKTWRKEKFDLHPYTTPKSAAAYHWLNCYMVNNCIQLNNGKLMCAKISNVHYFIEYFKEQCVDMYVSNRDYIDIHKVQSIEKIFDFFCRPFPFCKYCDVCNMEETEWSVSKKLIEEWT